MYELLYSRTMTEVMGAYIEAREDEILANEEYRLKSMEVKELIMKAINITTAMDDTKSEIQALEAALASARLKLQRQSDELDETVATTAPLKILNTVPYYLLYT